MGVDHRKLRQENIRLALDLKKSQQEIVELRLKLEELSKTAFKPNEGDTTVVSQDTGRVKTEIGNKIQVEETSGGAVPESIVVSVSDDNFSKSSILSEEFEPESVSEVNFSKCSTISSEEYDTSLRDSTECGFVGTEEDFLNFMVSNLNFTDEERLSDYSETTFKTHERLEYYDYK